MECAHIDRARKKVRVLHFAVHIVGNVEWSFISTRRSQYSVITDFAQFPIRIHAFASYSVVLFFSAVARSLWMFAL